MYLGSVSQVLATAAISPLIIGADKRGAKVDAAVRHFENFWQFYDLVQMLLCADRRFFKNMQRSLSWKVPG